MARRLMANHLAVRERRRLLMIRWSLSFFSSGSLLMICNHTHTQSTQCVCTCVCVRACVCVQSVRTHRVRWDVHR